MIERKHDVNPQAPPGVDLPASINEPPPGSDVLPQAAPSESDALPLAKNQQQQKDDRGKQEQRPHEQEKTAHHTSSSHTEDKHKKR